MIRIDEESHPGILEIPADKSVDKMPLSHFKTLVSKNGYAPIIRALNNLVRWNHNTHPTFSNKVHKIMNDLHKWHYATESLDLDEKDAEGSISKEDAMNLLGSIGLPALDLDDNPKWNFSFHADSEDDAFDIMMDAIDNLDQNHQWTREDSASVASEVNYTNYDKNLSLDISRDESDIYVTLVPIEKESLDRSEMTEDRHDDEDFINPDDIQQGDFVDFGPYGNLYVCSLGDGENFRVTDRKKDRFNDDASGWYIRSNYAKKIVQSADKED